MAEFRFFTYHFTALLRDMMTPSSGILLLLDKMPRNSMPLFSAAKQPIKSFKNKVLQEHDVEETVCSVHFRPQTLPVTDMNIIITSKINVAIIMCTRHLKNPCTLFIPVQIRYIPVRIFQVNVGRR